MIKKTEKGSAMLEFVLIMPIMFVMIMTVMQLAHIWMARQVVKYAAYCAARAALTSNKVTAHAHARDAAKQVCAWITFSENAEDLEKIAGSSNRSFWWNSGNIGVMQGEAYMSGINSIKASWDKNITAQETEIPGWGKIPHSSSLDSRIRVYAGLCDISGYNAEYPWDTLATVEFDFPLLMPVAGKMLSFLVKQGPTELREKINSGEVGFLVGSGWTGQQEIIENDKKAQKHAYPYITLKETCILPKPYSTGVYPVTSNDLKLGTGGLLQ